MLNTILLQIVTGPSFAEGGDALMQNGQGSNGDNDCEIDVSHTPLYTSHTPCTSQASSKVFAACFRKQGCVHSIEEGIEGRVLVFKGIGPKALARGNARKCTNPHSKKASPT